MTEPWPIRTRPSGFDIQSNALDIITRRSGLNSQGGPDVIIVPTGKARKVVASQGKITRTISAPEMDMLLEAAAEYIVEQGWRRTTADDDTLTMTSAVLLAVTVFKAYNRVDEESMLDRVVLNRLAKALPSYYEGCSVDEAIGKWEATPGRTLEDVLHVLRTRTRLRDDCSICQGRSGGVPGNENVIGGKLVCDYCHAADMTLRGM
ncbi:hypothetical protein CcrColossus_gp352 [Caulobacter phage CcrColossus]|uniref:Uncharacterized protein n=1 Tax=Caulobacter phage CcrColossus TaxID=1211640 RepID=K4K6L9_9CAUD|nr:hypothetical protein CcrColossus_gp352 [Caulobacter phage CcrColossus]AFU88222.1 hypothetical protein CcrColossus_gp352 [Caulobacter phage CcrColossus]